MANFQATVILDVSFFLVMNMMRNRCESQSAYGPFDSFELALAFHDGELAPESWSDKGRSDFSDGEVSFCKSFKQGSPLEWFNPLTGEEREKGKRGVFGHGIYETTSIVSIQSQTQIGGSYIQPHWQ